MTRDIGFYLRNIFLSPVAAAEEISAEKNLWSLILVSSLLGILPYWLIVLLGYQALEWNAFPYKQYYPYYFDPYWWEMLVVPVWGLAIAVGFSLPCYYFGKWFGGKAWGTALAIFLSALLYGMYHFASVDEIFTLQGMLDEILITTLIGIGFGVFVVLSRSLLAAFFINWIINWFVFTPVDTFHPVVWQWPIATIVLLVVWLVYRFGWMEDGKK